MNQIAKLLPLEHIVVGLEAGSKKRVFEQVGLMFENVQGLSREQVFDALFSREKLGSTALGQGIAIPHGRIKGLKNACGAFYRLTTPVPFDAPDGKPVGLMFILLVPQVATEFHLQLLSELAQMFSDREFREALLAAVDAVAVRELFVQWHPAA